MKNPPTFADQCIHAALIPHNAMFMPPEMKNKIASARRFVLDKQASSFLADLSESYIKQQVDKASKQKIGWPRFNSFRDSVTARLKLQRELSRLPHALMWIEYDEHEFRKRLKFYKHIDMVVEADNFVASKGPPCSGWLFETHGETEFSMRPFTEVIDQYHRIHIAALGFRWRWSTEDHDVTKGFHGRPFESRQPVAYLAVGIAELDIPQVGFEFTNDNPGLPAKIILDTVKERLGEMRHVWGLLASINDIPVSLQHAQPSKGFVARGQYRKFLSHTIINLVLPKGRDPVRLARTIVEMARRRAHQVRGHWRRDWRHEGERIWIKEHQRGDASLGFVLHDYNVTHEEKSL
jgi:hypothetical protein